jgi:hypothetical protein
MQRGVGALKSGRSSGVVLAARSRVRIRIIAAALAAGLFLTVPAQALHKNSPPAIRLSKGAPTAHAATPSWDRHVAFVSSADLAGTGNTTRQVFLFNLFAHDCDIGGVFAGCPLPPVPPIRQITSGPGDPDDPSINQHGTLIAFDALGSYAGGTGPAAAYRQIFLLDLVSGTLRRVTNGTDGDSVRPSLNRAGGRLVFESSASLIGPGGVSQIYLYDTRVDTLQRLTNGAAPSRSPALNKLGTVVAFESRARLLGNGADSGISQIFWYDVKRARIFQLTDGNGPSINPTVSSAVKSRTLRASGIRRVAILFDSTATNLPGTAGGPGRQAYAGSVDLGDLPTLVQLTPVAVPGCTPANPGESSHPTIDPTGRRIAFVSTGDLLCNGTTGRRAFVTDMRRAPATLYQMTGRGDVEGPLGTFLGLWFLTLSTTDDLTGQGVCGHQLQVIDYFTGRWAPATAPGQIPLEPPAGNPDAGCDDGNACTTDTCGPGGICTNTPIGGCP